QALVAGPTNALSPAAATDPDDAHTGYTVDDSVTLTASGSWCFSPLVPTDCFGPDGKTSQIVGAGFLLPGAPLAALVGRVGDSGPWTLIGAGPSTLNGRGELHLAM